MGGKQYNVFVCVHLSTPHRLELFGCNELSDAGLWASLNSRITTLSLADCINVADDTIAAVAQLLPGLQEFNLQVG